jgi:hypothetical protein
MNVIGKKKLKIISIFKILHQINSIVRFSELTFNYSNRFHYQNRKSLNLC